MMGGRDWTSDFETNDADRLRYRNILVLNHRGQQRICVNTGRTNNLQHKFANNHLSRAEGFQFDNCSYLNSCILI